MTPRQIAAYSFLAERRQERENLHQFSVLNLSQSTEKNKVQAQINEWGDQ